MTATLNLFTVTSRNLKVRPAPVNRVWMDNTPQRFAYRCLPLKIANSHGWELLNDRGFTAMWDGKAHREGLIIVSDDGKIGPAISHFGSGILTFHVDGLFQTDPNVNLLVQGPINSPKDGIHSLTGIVETDWSPMTFTMNWLFTRPNICVRFEENEPICSFFPLSRNYLEDVNPVLKNISSVPELSAEYGAFSRSRNEFNRKLSTGDIENKPWQKHYHNGESITGCKNASESHLTKLKLKPFINE